MPWIAVPLNRESDGRIGGRTFRMRPDAAQASDAKEIRLPDNVFPIQQQSSWASDGIGVYNAGGYTQNIIITKNWQAWPLGMRAPGETPDVSLTAGPGLTAEVICYLRGFDELTGERTPLSGPSQTLSAANQTITYSNLDDVQLDPRWTHLEGWESRDGGLPRLVWRRQIGVQTVVHSKPLGLLGEAETSTWTKPPKCRFAVFWHGRLVLAGDDHNPTTIYFMSIGFPERWEGLSLDMKTRQRIVGMGVVNDRLLAFGAKATETVSGWTEDDLRIDIAQPDKGLISHHALVNIDSYMFIPTEEQPFMTDGSSWFPMGKDIKTQWARDYKANRKLWQQMFVDHHPDEHLFRWYIGKASSDFRSDDGYVMWVADYEPTLPLQGGGFAQPRWSYDLISYPLSCAALMGVPGGRRRDPFAGARFGAVMRAGGDDTQLGADALPDGTGDADNIMDILTGALQFQRYGGPVDHAMKLIEMSVILRSEVSEWQLRIYSGDVGCIVPPLSNRGNVEPGIVEHAPDPKFDKTIQGTLLDPVEIDTGTEIITQYFQEEWSHFFREIQNVAGRAFKVRITIGSPEDVQFSGLFPVWDKGTTARQYGRKLVQQIG